MPHAVFSDLEQRFGAVELGDAVPPGLSGSPADYWAQHLLAASADIDRALRRIGYTVPVDLAAIADVDERAATTALLRSWCVTLAREYGSAAESDSSKGAKTAADRVRAALADLVAGKTDLGLPLRRSFASAGERNDRSSTQQTSPHGVTIEDVFDELA